MKPTLPLFAAALALALASPAYAQVAAPAEVPAATKTWVGGQVFSDFSVPTSAFFPQAFEIKRARIYANAAFNPTWSAAVVYNVRAMSYDLSGKSVQDAEAGYLEMGYVQATNLYPGSRVQMGAIITPWFEYEAKAWGYRMLGLLPDAGGLSPDRRGVNLVPFYDFGASLKGDCSLAGIPLGYSLAVLNGEDVRHTETDGQKDYEGRLSVTALPGLELTGMVHRHNQATGPATREAGLAVYEQAGYKLALETVFSQDTPLVGASATGQILGGWVVVPIPGMPIPTEAVVRADYITGDTKTMDVAKGYRFETVAGLNFTPVKGVRLFLNNQNLDFHNADGSALVNEDIVALNTELTF
ncbi:MAG: hypothetical protein JWM80_875 [Cyanobacteria bacterium RYN_339]|nr:hypothetical protein [Cyanobacteria bacterium RYN_339]